MFTLRYIGCGTGLGADRIVSEYGLRSKIPTLLSLIVHEPFDQYRHTAINMLTKSKDKMLLGDDIVADMRWKAEREEIIELVYRIQADYGGSLPEREARKFGSWATDVIKRAKKIRWLSSKGAPPVLSITNKSAKSLDAALASRGVVAVPHLHWFGGSVAHVETEYGGPVVLPLSYEPYNKLKEWAVEKGILTQNDLDRVAHSPRMEPQEPEEFRMLEELSFPGTRWSLAPMHYDDGHPFGGGFLDPAGHEGPYQVTATLTRRGAPDVTYMYVTDAYAMEGDSHLRMVERRNEHGVLAIPLLTYANPEGGTNEFQLLVNQQGRLGQIRTVLRAQGADDARRKAYRILNPFLCDLSYRYDVLVKVLQMNVVELATLTVGVMKQDDFREKVFDPEAFLGPGLNYGELPLYEFFMRLYREGANSSSVDYGFLCFFRIAEGVMKMRRKKINEEEGRKVSLADVFLDGEVIDGEGVDDFPQELHGKSLWSAYKKLCEERDKIAHAFLNNEDPVAGHADIIADRLEGEESAGTRRAQARYLSRRMLQSEFWASDGQE